MPITFGHDMQLGPKLAHNGYHRHFKMNKKWDFGSI